MTARHYENFPVASIVLPRRFREPVALIYNFARQADDFADEGNRSKDERLALLRGFRSELDSISSGKAPGSRLFIALSETLRLHRLPLSPLYDLLDAFTQDVEKKRYADFDEILAYCSKSANPVGRLLLALYEIDSEKNRFYSDRICTSLQLINFLQDVEIDLEMGRIYLPENEMTSFGISEIEPDTEAWRAFMKHQAHRAREMMLEGAPLAGKMQGRLSFEMRMIVLGGLRILEMLDEAGWNMFLRRPKLRFKDWTIIVLRAIFWRSLFRD